MLSYALLIVSVCIVIGLCLYLFFWNRLVAFFIGCILRLLFWNKGESSIWVELGSIHFSLIAGRILFKDLRYHSSNQTIRVVKGQISWRYWIRAPAGEEDLSHARVMGEDIGAGTKKKTALACRLHMSLQGLEWFIYNRIAAYDNIARSMEPSTDDQPQSTDGGRPSADGLGSLRKIFSWSSTVPNNIPVGPPVSLVSSIITRAPSVVKKSLAWGKGQLPNLDPKDLLPISIEVTKGAIVIGNDASPSLLVAEFQSSEGTYGIVPARSKYDMYKNVLNLTFQNASICYVDSPDYDDFMSVIGEKIHSAIQMDEPHPLHSFSYTAFTPFAQLWQPLKLWAIVSRHARNFPIPYGGLPASWNRRRARKTFDGETPLGSDFSTVEYAKETKILEAPVIEMLYYADVVGMVPEEPEEPEINVFMEQGDDPFDIGNGDSAPEWGMDLAIKGGLLRYGPWGDRQRAILQQVFFPPNFNEAVPQVHLKPGDTRMWTCMKILIELRDGVSLQIPFRESSKNWQWDGEVEVPNLPRQRDAASIHVKAGDSSTISYMMPMIATERGYEPTFNVHLDTVTVTSSLNDIRLITAESCGVRCELPSSLKWNEQRQWTFTVVLRKPILFLLRDHINMFTDLGKDWSSGPPADSNRFIPMIYMLDIRLENFELNMYVNDHNIIDKPLLRDENGLLCLRGSSLRTDISIPFTKYRPASTKVSFRIEGPDVTVGLTLPKWNTRSLYSRPHWYSDVGHIGLLHVDVSYCYHADVHVENVDQLRVDITARDVVYKMCGWTIRHFMIMRNNYFGAFTHFSTLYEYLARRRLGLPLGDPVDLQYREGSSNSLQVHLGVAINSGLMIMPAGLRGYERDRVDAPDDNDIGACLMLSFPEFQVYMRSHDYFMELSLNIDAIYGTVHATCSEDITCARSTQREAKETFVVDGLDVLAHRLFGPQPHTTTYLCIWEIHAGAVKVSLDTWEARILKTAAKSFGLNYTDPLNAPAAEYEIPSPPDVTFLKITLDMLNIVWNAGSVAVELALPHGLRMDTNDLAGQAYSKVTSFRIPSVCLKILLAANETSGVWHEALECTADANVDVYSAPFNWREKAKTQSEFLAAQDSHTGRAIFLYMPDQSVPYDSLAPGRGLLDTEFYIPQLRIPKPTSSTKFTRQGFGSSETPNKRGARFRAYPESEEEELISEVDRDARLAKSRPGQSIIIDNDDDSITSGDESDNASITDSDHSGSELGGREHETEPDVWPVVTDYFGLVRCYEKQYLRKPSWWTKSPFHLLRERAYSLDDRFARTSSTQPESEDIPSWDEFRVKFQDTVDTSITRVASNRGVTIWFSPLVLPAVEVVLKQVQDESQQMSPELRLDNIVEDYIQSLTSAKAPSEKASVTDVYLASVQASVLQSTRQIKRDALVEEDELCKTLHFDDATIDCRLKAFHLKLSSSNGPPVVSSSFSSLNAGIGTIQAFDDACFVLVGRSMVSLDNNSLVVSLADIICESKDYAAEHIFASFASLYRCANNLRASAISYNQFMATLDLHMIVQAITFAKDKSVVDPLSTIQPSYLIQSGRPHKLRTDVFFKYLVHLRNTLQYLNDSERRQLVPLDGNVHVVLTDEVKELIEDHLLQFGADLQVPIYPTISLLQTLLASQADKQSSPPPPPLNYSLTAFSVKLARINTVLRSATTADSEFFVEPFVVTIRLGATEQHQIQTIGAAARSSATLSLAQHEIRRFGLVISVGNVVLSVNPGLIRFAQTLLRVYRHYWPLLVSPQANIGSAQLGVSASAPTQLDTNPLPYYYADVVLTTRFLRFRAGAENLVIEYDVWGVDYTSSSLIKTVKTTQSALDISMNHSMGFDRVRLQARAVEDISRPDEFGVLAAFIIDRGRINILLRQEPAINSIARVMLKGDNVLVNVPRSAMRLYRFMEEWRADYLPGIESMVQSLLTELNQTSHKSPKPPSTKDKIPPAIHIDLSIASIRISLQVMRGTWLAWELGQIIGYFYTPEHARKTRDRTFGLQIGSHVLMISSKAQTSDATPNVRVRMPLPTFSFAGVWDGKSIQSLALLEFFSVTVKPSHWDTLLSVQQKFGQDFNDLVAHIAQGRRKKPHPSKSVAANPWKYRVLARMKGFSIGLDGVSSTLFLDCDHVGGAVSNDAGLGWHVELSDLALSLASNSERREHTIIDSHNRSVFVVIDGRAEMRESTKGRGQKLDLKVTKIHAVMQPSSIGQIGDYIDHLQAEILIRKGQRAQELAEFKQKTRNFIQTFEMRSSPSQAETLSFFDQYSINVAIMNVGVAFPLTFSHELRTHSNNSSDADVKAFLFSIKSISFGIQRGENGQASMKGFSFQFVPQFRQNVPRDFSGEGHSTRNKLLYPEMTAHLQSERWRGSRELHISADVDGFILDIDSSIPDYITSLVQVYRQGKERVDRLAGAVPRNTPITEIPQPLDPGAAEQEYNPLPASNIFLSLTFESGRVRMFSEAYTHANRSRAISTPIHEYTEGQIRELGAEIFNLPVVSVWGEYRATPALTKLGGKSTQQEPSTLVFKSTVHSSQNTLRPTLLPFITEIVDHVEERLRESSANDFRSSPVLPINTPTPTITPDVHSDPSSVSASSLQISLSLRIDQSKLELTCQPDVNVVAGLNWDSGGFVVNISPGAHQVTFSGSVGGLTVGLKHGFLSEDCMKLHARNLAFSMDFAKGLGQSASSVSVVCDTEFSGGVRFSRLQDILCFKAVWLDRIPVISAPAITPGSSKSKVFNQSTPSAPNVKQPFSTVVLLRLRRVELDVDLGQSISSIQLSLSNAVLRTRMTEATSELSLSVYAISATASGNLAGRLSAPDFMFQTTRTDRTAHTSRMLDLRMTSGPLEIELESEYQKILLYRAEPLNIRIFDDWSMFSSNVPLDDRRVRLAFTIEGRGLYVVMNVGTVPRLVSYATKFKANLDAQREGASRESQAFRISSSPRPENALSEVANAMFSSARDKLRESEGFSYIIGQQLSLKLKNMRLILFPRSMSDPELAQFTGSDVHARLDRLVESETLPPKRDLELSFFSMAISKLSQLHHGVVAREQSKGLSLDTLRFLSLLTENAGEATIFSLPSMDMHMHSDEYQEDGTRILPYTFSSQFSGKQSSSGRDVEDIYITLNMSLYAWLTILRKSFAREMDQVRASAEAQNPLGGLGQSTTLPRRKQLESLLIADRDALPLSQSPEPMSPATSKALLQHTRSTPARYTARAGAKSPTQVSQSPSSAGGTDRFLSPITTNSVDESAPEAKRAGITYQPLERHIERLTMRQLGEATPDVMHPFFMKTSGFSLEDSLPQYVHEYATMPAEEIMKALLKLYSKQLSADNIASPGH